MRARLVEPGLQTGRRRIHAYLGTTRSGKRIPTHWHQGWELHILLAGREEHQVGDQRWQLRGGDCLLLGGSAAHAIQATTSNRFALWQIHPAIAQNLAARYPQLSAPTTDHDRSSSPWRPRHLGAEDLACIRACTARALTLCDQTPKASREAALEALAEAVLALIANAPYSTQHAYPPAPFPAVLEAIRKRPEHHWTRAELQRRTGLDRNRLATAFQDHCGTGLRGFVRQCRLAMARDLMLTEPDTPLATVAACCGFASTAAFSRAFAIHLGCSPSRWRRSNLCTVGNSQS